MRSNPLACILLLGVVAACGETPLPDPVDPPVPPVQVTCDTPGVERCGDACVSTASDPSHCGGCGKACAAGDGCQRSACVTYCQLDGRQVFPGTVNAANSCEQCAPVVSTTAWTPRADGMPCNPGQICAAGTCAPKCLIDGVLHEAGAPNPANACEVCAPATSTTQWMPRASVPLLVGGEDIEAQGWKMNSMAPSLLSYGPDYVRLTTSTSGSMGGVLLISLANAVDTTKPFTLRMKILVEAVNRHNQLDSGAAILAGYTPVFGQSVERAQMIYLDSGAIGWADDSQSAAFSVTDGKYHDYELSVDAAKVARVSIDGVEKLTRSNFSMNGTLALGDQTNDPNVDGTMRIKSVERLCP